MAVENAVLIRSFVAGEDLSSYQYHFVTNYGFTGNQVGLMNAGTDMPIGILQNAPTSGQTAEVMVMGESKLKANAALAVGVYVKAEYVSTSDCGKADAADTEGDNVRGVTTVASGAEDDVCSVLLTGPFKLSVPA